jgi:choline dehydrogenase
MNCERSHSGLGHYENIINGRSNYDLLVMHKVQRVVYKAGSDLTSAPRVEVLSVASNASSNASSTIIARGEVIISAGSIHTPQILQRSGIGPPAILKPAGIETLVNLPGVGANFHDHPSIFIGTRANLTSVPGLSQSSLRSNETFRKEAEAQYALRPAQGPYTMVGSSTAVYVGLPNITVNYSAIAKEVLRQVEDGSFARFLPAGSTKEQEAGYAAQLRVLAAEFTDWRSPVLESIVAGGGPAGSGYLLKPLSRGTVHINASDPEGEPVINYGTLSNPLDVTILSSFVGFLRAYLNTPTMVALGARETFPGTNVTTSAELDEYVRRSAGGSFAHPCCTAAMMPRGKGGVVGPDLKVHGTTALRVVDASIFPLVPGTHTSSTVYAIAEKAADIIIREWQGRS